MLVSVTVALFVLPTRILEDKLFTPTQNEVQADIASDETIESEIIVVETGTFENYHSTF